MRRILSIALTLIINYLLITVSLVALSDAFIINGPMLSDLTYREAQIWTQTDKKANIKIHYYENDNPDKIFISPEIETNDKNGYTANFSLSKIEPNKKYTYYVELNGVLNSKKYEFNSLNYYYEKEPPPNIRVALVGAHYAIEQGFEPPYAKLGGSYSIFQRIYEANPDLVLWVGNTAHLRKSDLDSKYGYLKRYSYARSLIKPKELLAQIPNLGIWSSNDYGINSSGKEMSMKEIAQEAFSLFWPKAKLVSHQQALCYNHKISDIEFFFLDVQSQRKTRASLNEQTSILGKKQIEWLKESLLTSTSKFKIIVSGVPILNPSKQEKNLSFAEGEKRHLLEFLKNHKIPGLFFISGGSYKGELTRIVHSTHYNFFDLTVGPSTAIPILEDQELNFYRIPGTNTFEQQYAILDFSGDEADRSLDIQIFSLAGSKLWARTIKANYLKVNE